MSVKPLGCNPEGILTNDGGSFGLILDSPRAAEATVSREECREVNGSLTSVGKGTNADTFCLEVLECPRDI